jgi:hypothetical protein
MDLRIQLDNCFYNYCLGGVYFKRLAPDNFWPENEQDYVAFGVPDGLRSRFDPFWEKVVQQLGHRLERYQIKECVRLPSGRTLYEKMYFLPVKGAELLLLNFDKLASEVFGSAAGP